jgi:SAM-dependent methyltransferase
MSEHLKAAFPAIIETIAHYYAERLRAFGATPPGADWNSADSQALRFDRLLQVLEGSGERSINDYGCGYGALVDYLDGLGDQFRYCGFDIAESMIETARARCAGRAWCEFVADLAQMAPADYTVASGVFNVKLDYPAETWHEYVLQTLAVLDSVSTRGFAFNMLSTYSDPEKRRLDLFYADPREMFDFCKSRFSRRVSLLHDYPLYEFTIIVRK